MKITDPDIIKSGERELIDAITGDLDWEAIGRVVREKHQLDMEDIQYHRGDIVVYQNQIAYKLDFDVRMTFSVYFDRNGNCLSVPESSPLDTSETRPEETVPPKMEQQMTDIADMMSDINE